MLFSIILGMARYQLLS